jgi:small subunit ribosomal protein S13
VARISGVTIPDNKQVWVSLTYVHGIGPKVSKDILKKARVEEITRVKNLNDAEIARIQDVINADYVEIKSYRGTRHAANLPSHGQRTKTNARTRRGRKVTVGGTAKKVAAKT